ncbi:MAG: hypothetical protein HOO06_04495 [Bdellovibrionaceae bacterium]|jgi:hypothetical protein|nr:hypothetical protein [Pseudobdellovibrionaceae bacterium]
MSYRAYILIFLLIASLVSCTSKKEKPKITVVEYKKQSVILVGVASKLLSERSVDTMHKMAVSIQQSRAIACIQVGEECKVYGQMMSKMIQYTKDNQLTAKEKIELRADFKEFVRQLKVESEVLEKQWAEFTKTDL